MVLIFADKRKCFFLGLVLVSRTLYAKLMFDYFKEWEDIQVRLILFK